MKKLVNSFDVDENFWEVNTQFKLALGFKKLFKEDRSRGKKDSSRIMWFVSLVYDRGSIFFNVPFDEKVEAISEDYMNDSNYYIKNRELIDEISKEYILLTTTSIDRHLNQWEESLNDRTRFLSTVRYSLENFDDLDKMAANTTKVFETFKKIKEDQVKEASGSGDIKGGGMESLNDSGEI